MRSIVSVFLLAAMAVALPVAAQTPPKPTEQVSCGASSGVTASPLLPQTSPSCSYEISCLSTGPHGFCEYAVNLDVNGAGQVAGTMQVELLTGLPGDRAEFVSTGFVFPVPAADPSCGPDLFNCSFATTSSTPVILLVRGLARITCAGGGLSALEGVYCSNTFLGAF